MRLISYGRTDRAGVRVGAVTAEGVVDLGDRFAAMLDLIGQGATGLAEARDLAATRPPSAALDDVRLAAPIPSPRRNVWCVGWNYLAHFEEGIGRRGTEQRDLPDHPAFFSKATTTVVGPDAPIPLDQDITERLDYEAELAVIIGRRVRSVPEAEALGCVFGYTLANDVSARDLQRRHGGQWLKGKSLDGTCPMGPWIVTADEIPDPQALRVQCLVNGEVRQDASTGQMIFSVARLIAELSRGTTLLPGDILLTGTPDGVGFARTPPVYLAPGDEVVVRIAAIGDLRNRVAATRLD